MEILIKNCNSIDEAKITLEVGTLNIKYGANGTGKSTIAKAIELSARGGAELHSLNPFKHRGKEVNDDSVPAVLGANDFKSVAVFNEEYVNQFIFKQDEVLKNSFEIFIRNSDYDAKMAEIESLVSKIKDTFSTNATIDLVCKDLTDLSESFGKSKSGYSQAGKIAKGIGSGNKLEHIPEKLAAYSTLIKSASNFKWIKWQIEGNDYHKVSSDCPYCTSSTEGKNETILAVGEEYDAKSIEHLTVLQAITERLGKYFSAETVAKIGPIIRNKDGLKKEEINYLTTLKQVVDTLIEKLVDIKSISFFSLRDAEKVQATITNLKIDLTLLPNLDSVATRSIVSELNLALDEVLIKAGALQGEINKQKKGIETAITKHKKEINEFLRYAGYKYVVDIPAEGNSYKMKLKHIDFGGDIGNGGPHLSYGERNAFAIVLFMYECLSKSPDLIVLDDPISSFDKNKKFAMLKMLFRGKGSLQEKTVLLLTHDIEPIIDMIKNLGHTFYPMPSAHFLRSSSGVVTEERITKDDISSFAQICMENIANLTDDLIKAIYLRRHFEIDNNKGFAYQLLSNLLHRRLAPELVENNVTRPMTVEEIAGAATSIRLKMPSFDYDALVRRCNDKSEMARTYESASNNYEKLQLFRIAHDEKHENDVVRKYINESFHIENEFIMQLNPHKYDFVPQHIIFECNQYMFDLSD